MSNYQNPPFQQPAPQPQFTPPRKRHVLRNILLVVGGLFALLIVASVLSPGTPAQDASTPVVTPVDNGPDPVVTPSNEPVVTEAPVEPPVETEPVLTTSQEQAVGAAQQYLEVSAFSRQGLIDQLTSAYGSGFSKSDAVYAVDHVGADWNEQAARAAQQYLEVSHFSRSGLIEQLESRYGGRFTHSQAVYGVKKAGL